MTQDASAQRTAERPKGTGYSQFGLGGHDILGLKLHMAWGRYLGPTTTLEGGVEVFTGLLTSGIGAELGSRAFLGDTFNIRWGGEWRYYNQTLADALSCSPSVCDYEYEDEFGNETDGPSHTATDFALSLALGNRWYNGTSYFGVDWVGASIPVFFTDDFWPDIRLFNFTWGKTF